MRKAYFLLLLAPAALVYACGGGDDTDGGTDAASDQTVPGDSSKPDTGAGDTGATDTGTDTGSTDAGMDVTITVSCLRPANCFDGGAQDAAYAPDAGEVCCGTVSTSGTFPGCNFNSASTACEAPSSCATSFGTSSCGTDTVRLCAADKECTENSGNPLTTYDKCCSFKYQDAAVHICANSTIASLASGTCP